MVVVSLPHRKSRFTTLARLTKKDKNMKNEIDEAIEALEDFIKKIPNGLRMEEKLYLETIAVLFAQACKLIKKDYVLLKSEHLKELETKLNKELSVEQLEKIIEKYMLIKGSYVSEGKSIIFGKKYYISWGQKLPYKKGMFKDLATALTYQYKCAIDEAQNKLT